MAKFFGSMLRLAIESPKKLPSLAACVSLWRQPSLLAMTHMRWVIGLMWAREHGLHRGVVPSVSGFLTGWPIDGCSNKDAGRSESETLTPCEKGTKTGLDKRRHAEARQHMLHHKDTKTQQTQRTQTQDTCCTRTIGSVRCARRRLLAKRNRSVITWCGSTCVRLPAWPPTEAQRGIL